jgi:hypothetical protein
LTNLEPGTKYYIKAYISDVNGTKYGNEISFSTPSISVPAITTTSVSSIKATTASSGGNINSDGGAPIKERGVCWYTTSNPTISNSKTSDGTGTGPFTSSISGLTANSTYYLRAYAINNMGTGYGNEISFTTSAGDPLSTPLNLVATPGDKEVMIKWDTVTGATTYNIYWSTNPDVSTTNFMSKISSITTNTYLQTGLTSGATYYYVVTAINNYGESSESSVIWATLPLLLQTNTMSASSEKHYYQVAVSSGQTLFVTLNIADRSQSYYLYVKYGSVPTGTVYDVKSETGHDEAISIANTQSGTYYIMVYAKTFNSSYSGNYKITGSTDVIVLNLGTTFNTTFNHTEEKHYYEVSVTSGQSLTVTIHRTSTNQYYLYGKYGSLPSGTVYDAISQTGHDETINITNTKSGTYYIMVYANTFSILDPSYSIRAYIF